MRIQLIFISLILAFLPIAVFAGDGHDHGHGHSHGPVTQEKAITTATRIVTNMVNQGVIEESWKSVQATSAEQKEFGGQSEWVIVFNNKKVTDAAKQMLYVFLTIDGRYLAANYTGK
ncbi:MAG: DUF6488 family protein [Candidatus Thiodiazotropha sp. 4PDIVS1]